MEENEACNFLGGGRMLGKSFNCANVRTWVQIPEPTWKAISSWMYLNPSIGECRPEGSWGLVGQPASWNLSKGLKGEELERKVPCILRHVCSHWHTRHRSHVCAPHACSVSPQNLGAVHPKDHLLMGRDKESMIFFSFSWWPFLKLFVPRIMNDPFYSVSWEYSSLLNQTKKSK